MIPSWVKIIVPLNKPKFRVVCFPHGGSGASAYFRWCHKLKKHNVEIASIQYPGREDRLSEPPMSSLVSFAEEVASLPSSFFSCCGYALFGHSMGASIAFEVARRIIKNGKHALPTRVFISGKNPPHSRLNVPSIGNYSDQDLLREIGKRYGALPQQLMEEPEMRQLIARVLRADLNLLERYYPEVAKPIPIPISVYAGKQDQCTDAKVLGEWQQYSNSPLGIRIFEGGHFFHQLCEDEVLQAILTDIKSDPGNAPCVPSKS